MHPALAFIGFSLQLTLQASPFFERYVAKHIAREDYNAGGIFPTVNAESLTLQQPQV